MITRDNRGETGMTFAAKEQSRMVEKGGCWICGHYGHEEATCYEVIGYPPNWESRGRGRGRRGGQANSKGRGGPGRETAAVQEDMGLDQAHGGPKQISVSGGPGSSYGSNSVQPTIPGLSSEQVQSVFSALSMAQQVDTRSSQVTLNGCSTVGHQVTWPVMLPCCKGLKKFLL